MHFSFAKYHGLGNDFILIDDRQEAFPSEDAPFIAKLCTRRFGIGADGLILIRNSFKADYWMRIFNADGCETEMCGNGLRCFVAYLKELGLAFDVNRILVNGQTYTCSVAGDQVAVKMGRPKDVSFNIQLALAGQEVVVHHVNTGVPHAVVFVDDVESASVEKVGKEIRWHPMFQPKGVNANFVSEVAPGCLKMRTFERGVEMETPACGTGAAAVAFAATKMLGYPKHLKLLTALNETIEVRMCDGEEIEMLAGATFVFKGLFTYKGMHCIAV